MMSDILAAARWWTALAVVGLAAWPLAYSLLRRLPDRGFAFVRPIGLLVVGYAFWLGGSLGFAGNDGGGVVLALAVTAGLSWLAYRRRPTDDPPLRDWLRANRRTVVVTELLFLGVFALWVWVRAQNPAISATEKPMELAFLNGVGRSATFPPLDPWLSGYAISYYYFGYVMVSMLGTMANVGEPVAFNLAIAWLVAGTATGTFGVVYNLVAGEWGPGTASSEPEVGNGDRGRPFIRAAVLFGLIAALAVPVAGNMQMGLELLHGNGIGSDSVWAWLDVRDINGPAQTTGTPRYESSGWWWWRTSRVIHEYHLDGRAEEGLEPIVEIPSFSFVLGDLHPHVLALPFALLAIAVALAWYLMVRADGLPKVGQWVHAAGSRGTGAETRGLTLFTALLLGGLAFLNTWDVAIYLFLVAAATFLGGWFRQGTTLGLGRRVAVMAGLLLLAAMLLYLPFFAGFRSQAGAPYLLPFLMRPTRLAQFLVIFGLPLMAIAVFTLTLAARQRFRHWRAGAAAAGLLLAGLLVAMVAFMLPVAMMPGDRVGQLARELGLSLAPQPDGAATLGWALQAMAATLPSIVGARLASPWLVVVLAGLVGLVVMVWNGWVAAADGSPDRPATKGDRATPFALLLILTGVLLTLGPEFLYLRDNFGVRLNTTFKFYYQAWVMFGVAGAYGLAYLWLTKRTSRARVVAGVTTAAYGALLVVALLFPLYASRSRAIEYRGPARAADGTPLERQPATLDGLAYLARYNPAEYEAIIWLREQARAAAEPPVVLEAVGGQYSGYGRVSSMSGLPTLLGWPGHELQWRGSDNPEPGRREPIVQQIYHAEDLASVDRLLDEFNVTFIYVGGLEREKYGMAGLQKFADRLPVVFANDFVTIYRRQPAGATP